MEEKLLGPKNRSDLSNSPSQMRFFDRRAYIKFSISLVLIEEIETTYHEKHHHRALYIKVIIIYSHWSTLVTGTKTLTPSHWIVQKAGLKSKKGLVCP